MNSQTWTVSVIAVSLLASSLAAGIGLDPHVAGVSTYALFAAFVFATGASAIKAPACQQHIAR